MLREGVCGVVQYPSQSNVSLVVTSGHIAHDSVHRCNHKDGSCASKPPEVAHSASSPPHAFAARPQRKHSFVPPFSRDSAETFSGDLKQVHEKQQFLQLQRVKALKSYRQAQRNQEQHILYIAAKSPTLEGYSPLSEHSISSLPSSADVSPQQLPRAISVSSLSVSLSASSFGLSAEQSKLLARIGTLKSKRERKSRDHSFLSCQYRRCASPAQLESPGSTSEPSVMNLKSDDVHVEGTDDEASRTGQHEEQPTCASGATALSLMQASKLPVSASDTACTESSTNPGKLSPSTSSPAVTPESSLPSSFSSVSSISLSSSLQSASPSPSTPLSAPTAERIPKQPSMSMLSQTPSSTTATTAITATVPTTARTTNSTRTTTTTTRANTINTTTMAATTNATVAAVAETTTTAPVQRKKAAVKTTKATVKTKKETVEKSPQLQQNACETQYLQTEELVAEGLELSKLDSAQSAAPATSLNSAALAEIAAPTPADATPSSSTTTANHRSPPPSPPPLPQAPPPPDPDSLSAPPADTTPPSVDIAPVAALESNPDDAVQPKKSFWGNIKSGNQPKKSTKSSKPPKRSKSKRNTHKKNDVAATDQRQSSAIFPVPASDSLGFNSLSSSVSSSSSSDISSTKANTDKKTGGGAEGSKRSSSKTTTKKRSYICIDLDVDLASDDDCKPSTSKPAQSAASNSPVVSETSGSSSSKSKKKQQQRRAKKSKAEAEKKEVTSKKTKKSSKKATVSSSSSSSSSGTSLGKPPRGWKRKQEEVEPKSQSKKTSSSRPYIKRKKVTSILTYEEEQLRAARQVWMFREARRRFENRKFTGASSGPRNFQGSRVPAFFRDETPQHPYSLEERKAAMEMLFANQNNTWACLCLNADACITEDGSVLLKKHYRRMALLIHPDKVNEMRELATKAFQILSLAYANAKNTIEGACGL
mmetsp:Transcript_17/g.30  ORF Transcript_17/g.30 Transcript_17/m.30 type:complete len:936 (+) Transcript_17:36-2843(+)